MANKTNSATSLIPYGKQSIDTKDINDLVKILKGDLITQGPVVLEFEKALAKYVSAKYCVAVSSGTAALHAACVAAGIASGDEVIVPTMSFVATANCVLYCEASPVLVDVYEDTVTINVEEVEKKINKKTKAIIAVDFAGHPAVWRKLKSLAKRHKLILIADSAHALGSKYCSKSIGSVADLTCFSFHPVKIITTGEGGAITTNNKDFYEKLLRFRNHGMIKNDKLSKQKGGWFYEIEELGYNLRMTDMQAALGLSQLGKINSFINKRRQIWQKYNQAFSGNKLLVLPIEKDASFCAWHLYPLRFKVGTSKKKEIFEAFRKNGIGVQVHYIPIHFHKIYRKSYGYKQGDFPVAEKYFQEAFSLPLFPQLKPNEQSRVISVVKNIVKKYEKKN